MRSDERLIAHAIPEYQCRAVLLLFESFVPFFLQYRRMGWLKRLDVAGQKDANYRCQSCHAQHANKIYRASSLHQSVVVCSNLSECFSLTRTSFQSPQHMYTFSLHPECGAVRLQSYFSNPKKALMCRCLSNGLDFVAFASPRVNLEMLRGGQKTCNIGLDATAPNCPQKSQLLQNTECLTWTGMLRIVLTVVGRGR